jgi:hypothetical protein
MSDDDSGDFDSGDFDISAYDPSKIDTDQAGKTVWAFFSSPTGITIFVFIALFFIIIILFKFVGGSTTVQGSLGHISGLKGRLMDGAKGVGRTPLALFAMIGMMFYYFISAGHFYYARGKWRSNRPHIRALSQIKGALISNSLGKYAPLPGIASYSVIKSILAPNTVYRTIPANYRALVNWRPLTVRLAGYLGGTGTSPSMDGVFSMNQGITSALERGARGFFFDIDYLDIAPCNPVVIFRDDGNVMRSLNTGSITLACKTLAEKAFVSNTDPVVLFIYLRRIPAFPKQKAAFFKQIANALYELRTNFLKDIDSQNFHSCTNEGGVFLTEINKFESKFIISMNLDTFDTNKYIPPSNIRDNLHFFNNIRMYSDPQGLSAGLGAVTSPPKTGITPHIQVGHISQLLNLPAVAGSSGKSALAQYQESARTTFKVVIGSPDYEISSTEMSTLLNTNGAQCVPVDLLNLAMTSNYTKTMDEMTKKNKMNLTLTNLSELTNPDDPLSAWTFNGWSLKKYKEGFENAPAAPAAETPAPPPPPGDLPVFVIPQARKPLPPSPKMDAGGGLVKVV